MAWKSRKERAKIWIEPQQGTGLPMAWSLIKLPFAVETHKVLKWTFSLNEMLASARKTLSMVGVHCFSFAAPSCRTILPHIIYFRKPHFEDETDVFPGKQIMIFFKKKLQCPQPSCTQQWIARFSLSRISFYNRYNPGRVLKALPFLHCRCLPSWNSWNEYFLDIFKFFLRCSLHISCWDDSKT